MNGHNWVRHPKSRTGSLLCTRCKTQVFVGSCVDCGWPHEAHVADMKCPFGPSFYTTVDPCTGLDENEIAPLVARR